MKVQTLLFLIDTQEQKVLLAMKKRGFGVGKWNGVGGKVERGEAIGDAVLRETKEEIEVTVSPEDLEPVATIQFSFQGSPHDTISGHIFITKKWSGEPVETEEMAPKWFAFSDIPYSSMWVDDEHWLPQVLAGKKLDAKFLFSEDGSKILEMTIQEK